MSLSLNSRPQTLKLPLLRALPGSVHEDLCWGQCCPCPYLRLTLLIVLIGCPRESFPGPSIGIFSPSLVVDRCFFCLFCSKIVLALLSAVVFTCLYPRIDVDYTGIFTMSGCDVVQYLALQGTPYVTLWQLWPSPTIGAPKHQYSSARDCHTLQSGVSAWPPSHAISIYTAQ